MVPHRECRIEMSSFASTAVAGLGLGRASYTESVLEYVQQNNYMSTQTHRLALVRNHSWNTVMYG